MKILAISCSRMSHSIFSVNEWKPEKAFAVRVSLRVWTVPAEAYWWLKAALEAGSR